MARKVIPGRIEHAAGAELELRREAERAIRVGNVIDAAQFMPGPADPAQCPGCRIRIRPRRRLLIWLRRDLCGRCSEQRDRAAASVIAGAFALCALGGYLRELERAAPIERIIGREQ